VIKMTNASSRIARRLLLHQLLQQAQLFQLLLLAAKDKTRNVFHQMVNMLQECASPRTNHQYHGLTQNTLALINHGPAVSKNSPISVRLLITTPEILVQRYLIASREETKICTAQFHNLQWIQINVESHLQEHTHI